MKRVLRITASAFFGLMTVALIVLWVRSYEWRDYGRRLISKNALFEVITYPGSIRFDSMRIPGGFAYRSTGWTLEHERFDPESVSSTQFFWHSDAISTVLVLPMWVFVTVSLTLAAIPWFPFTKRFGLRTLLIGTTAIAMLLGLICYSIR